MSLGSSADVLLRDLAAARDALKVAGYDLAPAAFDQRIAELAVIAPRIVCPECRGRARGCATCRLLSQSGEPISLGVVCPCCGNARWVRVATATYTLPGDTSIAKLRACRCCMTYDSAGERWSVNDGKLFAAIASELNAAQARRRAALSDLESW